MRLRLPVTVPIWCVEHITSTGPVTEHVDTEQAAKNRVAHLTTGSSHYHAIYYASTLIADTTPEEQAA